MWYVQVTKPQELQHGNDKQIRRSTGTTDKREAEKRKHRITDEIYATFDAEFGPSNPQPKVKFNFVADAPDPLLQWRPKPVIPKLDMSLRMSRIWPRYMEERKWQRERTRNGVISHLKEFMAVGGDQQVDQLKKKHGYQYARHLDQSGYSNSTVGSRVRAVGTC